MVSQVTEKRKDNTIHATEIIGNFQEKWFELCVTAEPTINSRGVKCKKQS